MNFLSRNPIVVDYSKNDAKFTMHSYSSAILEMRFLKSHINNATIDNAIIFISDDSYAFLISCVNNATMINAILLISDY